MVRKGVAEYKLTSPIRKSRAESMRLRTYIVSGEGNVVGQHLLQFRQDASSTAADLANSIWFNLRVTRQHRNNPSRFER
jgi:hypothetical protein